MSPVVVADPVIAVDGPSGSGKGTLSAALARRLGWSFLDSGALYRIVARAALEEGIDLGDGGTVAGLARGLTIVFELGPEEVRVKVDGRDESRAIRTEPVSVAASRVAALVEVRTALLEVQRAFRGAPGLVADGRDMGTVVFPDARLKIFLEASPEERARRRYNQLKDKDLGVSLPGLLASIRERDERDRSRAASPLRPAADAVVIDSTSLTIDAVFEVVWKHVLDAGLAGLPARR
jgi:cytidylate kinase